MRQFKDEHQSLSSGEDDDSHEEGEEGKRATKKSRKLILIEEHSEWSEPSKDDTLDTIDLESDLKTYRGEEDSNKEDFIDKSHLWEIFGDQSMLATV